MTSRESFRAAGRPGRGEPRQPAAGGTAHTLASLQQQLLEVAIYAGGLRAQIGPHLPTPEAAGLQAQLEQAEQLRRALERQVAELERTQLPWWRRRR